jgi:outer membrane protein W
MLKKIALAAASLMAFVSGPSLAQEWGGVWHVNAEYSKPSSDFSGVYEGIPVVIEAESAFGLGFDYEIRPWERVGVNLGLSMTDFDFKVTVPGTGSADLGSSLMMPLSVGINFHFGGDKVDFYVGPTLNYVLWGNLRTDGGDASIDDKFKVGASLGVDIPFGDSDWIFSVGISHLQADLADSSANIGVDPNTVRIGFGKRK